MSAVSDALKVLEDEGRKHYKPECAASIPAYQCIGMAIAGETDSATDILNLAYSALEDWNYHDLCAVIEWAYPLYNQKFIELDLTRIQRKINKQNVEVLTEWNTEKHDYDKKTVNVEVIVSEVKP